MKIENYWNEWILKKVNIYSALHNLVNTCKDIIKMRDCDLNKLNDEYIVINVNKWIVINE